MQEKRRVMTKVIKMRRVFKREYNQKTIIDKVAFNVY